MVRDTTILRTTADQLMEFIKKKEKATIEETAKALKIPEKTVQALVDFLVEEKILGIEYKFTTPYIYLSKKDFKEPTFVRKKEVSIILSKEEFYNKAKARNIPYQKIETLWRKYLEKQLGDLKKQFYDKAKEKRIPESMIERLWQKYLSYL
jgi:predicted ArsR family transcriptional regulator